MATTTRKLSEKENHEFDQEIKKRASAYGKDVLIHIVLGLSAVIFFSIAALLKGAMGANAIKALDLFVGSGVSINVSLLTATIFLWGITLVFEGARFSHFLQEWLVLPGLTFFQLSCAVSLGICISYFFLIISGSKPSGDLASVLFTIALMTIVLGVQISMRIFFEVFAKTICDRACSEFIHWLFSKSGKTEPQMQMMASKTNGFVVFATGLVLAYTAYLQMPTDLEHAVRAAGTSSAEICGKDIANNK